jgi:hypothetical protein
MVIVRLSGAPRCAGDFSPENQYVIVYLLGYTAVRAQHAGSATGFGFDEVQAAYKNMASGAHFGKIVIHAA